jgi:hypothetical protein
MNISDEVKLVVKESTGSIASADVWAKALRLVQTSTIYFWHGAHKVRIPSESKPGTYYEFTSDQHCPCKAGQRDRVCAHILVRDMLHLQNMITEQEQYEQRLAARQRERQRVAATSRITSPAELAELFS